MKWFFRLTTFLHTFIFRPQIREDRGRCVVVLQPETQRRYEASPGSKLCQG